MSHRVKLALWVTGIAVATTVSSVILPGHREASVAAGAMALLAVLLIEMTVLAYRLAATSESAWSRVRHVPVVQRERPADLERIERRLGWGKYSAGDFNYRVRPLLRRLAAARLREDHGVDVEESPVDVRSLVSAELWDHVIAKQPPDSERVLTTADIALMVDEIESL